MAAPPTITVFDTVYDNNGKALVNSTVTCVLESTLETYAGGLITARTQTTLTDPTGRFQFTVICNDLLSPANSVYTITIPSIARSYQIAPQSANGSSQQTTASNVIVNTPTALAATTSNLTGPLTVAGLLTASAGLTVSGGAVTLPGGSITDADVAALSASKLTGSTLPAGITGSSLTSVGVLAAPHMTSPVVDSGGLTVTLGGFAVTGNSTVTGTLIVSALLTAQAGLTAIGTVTVPDSSFTMRKLQTPSGTDRGSAAGTWTPAATGGTTFINLTAPPIVTITPAVVSTLLVFWTVSWATGGVATSVNNWRTSLDGASFGNVQGLVVPTSGPAGMTLSGVDVFTGVSAAAHTIQLQVQTTAGSTSISPVVGGLSIVVLAIP